MVTGDDGNKQTAEVTGACLLSLVASLGHYDDDDDVIIEEE